MLFLFTFTVISCGEDEEGGTEEEVQQALFDMKGTYHGIVHVSGPNRYDKTLPNALAISRDSLKFDMQLQPLSELISDETISERLRDIGEVTVAAGYDFLQIDNGSINFVLYPKDVTILGGYSASTTIRIVFSKKHGGNAETQGNYIMFNISPTDLWIGGEKYESLPKITYHFEGVYE